MTRETAKNLQPAFNHFANGGNLWKYTINNNWVKMKDDIIFQWEALPSFIIEDKNFEARKAFALGEEVEYYSDISGWCKASPPSWNQDFEYRPKPQEPIYEWIWYTNMFVGGQKRTQFTRGYHATLSSVESSDNCFNAWKKVEVSKRPRK